MNYQLVRLKKLIGLAAMGMLATTIGWGLAPPTARADAGYRDDPGCFTWCDHHDHDRFFDRGRHDRDFFDHDRDFHPFSPFFFGR